ncbi:MAG: RQC domain-containing protein [Bacteroidota bacterium]
MDNQGMEKVNLQHEAMAIFKTVKLLEKPYSANYIINLLQGNTSFQLRIPTHQNLETFGVLEDHHFSYLENIVKLLLSRTYLLVINKVYGTLALSSQGERFLAKPQALEVSKFILYRPWHEIYLSKRLKDWRLAVSDREEKKPYEIMTNYVLSQVMLILPMSPMEVSRIIGTDGLNSQSTDELVQIIKDVQEKKLEDERSGIYRRVYSKRYRKIKELFEADIELDEISRRQGVEPRALREALLQLHQTGEINLRPWIEKHVPSTDLHRGTAYFKEAEDKRLSHAKEVLDMDYDTLAWCKAYIFHEEREALGV